MHSEQPQQKERPVVSDSKSESGTTDDGTLMLSAELSPADAPAERERVMAFFEKAKQAGEPLKVDIDGDNLSPCALQMLIATKRSAEIHTVEFAPSDAADSVLAPLT
jgi:hypothetical protein